MKIINEIKSIKDEVKKALTYHPHLRDNDQKLLSHIWTNQLDDKNIPASVFLNRLYIGSLIKPESIRRCRQKVQEQNPHLRGTKYKAKQEQGNEFREQIKDV